MNKRKLYFRLLAFVVLVVIVFATAKISQEINFYQKIRGPSGKISLAQYAAAKQLSSKGNVEITWDELTHNTPQTVEGPLTQTELGPGEKLTLEKAQETTLEFLDTYRVLYKLPNPRNNLRQQRVLQDSIGTYVHLEQHVNGIPVYGGGLLARLKPDGTLDYLSSHLYPDINLNLTPLISALKAKQTVSQSVGNPQLIILPSELLKLNIQPPYLLAWKIANQTETFFINAYNGEIIDRYPNIWDARNRETYSTTSCYILPGTLWINESGEITGQPVDNIARSAHRNAGITYDYYFNNFDLDSFDGQGHKLVSTVHGGVSFVFGCTQNNAAFNPSKLQIMYGDGDGDLYGPFANALDVVGHEWTHAVIYFAIKAGGLPQGLIYENESGALNESYSDFFGSLIENKNWLMGEDCYTPLIPGDALRDMADPARYNQPDHYSKYVNTGTQSWKVHTNSGIPNKAAYLMANGGQHYDINVTGFGKDVAGKIWYRALTKYLAPAATFRDARLGMIHASQDLYPSETAKIETVKNAFCAVGVYPGYPSAPTISDCPAGPPVITTPGPSPTSTLTPTLTPTPTPTLPPGITTTPGPTNTPRPTPTPTPTPPPTACGCTKIALYDTNNLPLNLNNIQGGQTIRIFIIGYGTAQWQARVRINSSSWYVADHNIHPIGYYYDYTIPTAGGSLSFEGQTNCSGTWNGAPGCNLTINVAPECPKKDQGDILCDGIINQADLDALIDSWENHNLEGDLNHDSQVNEADLTILLSHWQE